MSTQREPSPSPRQSSIAKFFVSLTGALLIVSAAACGGDDDGKSSDAPRAGSTAAGGGGGGGSTARGGAGGSGAKGEAQLGAACKRDADCGGGYYCDAEVPSSVPVQGAPGGMVDRFLYPGGSCTPKRYTTFDGGDVSCDPRESRGAQGCGDDGVCAIIPSSSSTPIVGCRKACDPSADESGCRTGYQCGYTSKFCTEGCQSDVDCKVIGIDTDDDGVLDANGFDSASNATCDMKTARCVHAAGSQASGQSCMRDDDCSEDGVCIPEGQSVAGQFFPGGYCSRQGCGISGHECDGDATCAMLRPFNGESSTEPLCFQGCKVGAEGKDLQLGEKGHGDKCREGYRCHYNGAGVDAGVCVGGNYNAVTKNNVGSECKKDADCYSPFGLGTCALYEFPNNVSSGICMISDCAVPGLPVDLCGENNECVASGSSDGSDESTCLHHCTQATDCPTGFACTDDDMDAKTPRNCIPLCLETADCRPNEKCNILQMGEPGGICGLQ